jgi:hypothetical protein
VTFYRDTSTNVTQTKNHCHRPVLAKKGPSRLHEQLPQNRSATSVFRQTLLAMVVIHVVSHFHLSLSFLLSIFKIQQNAFNGDIAALLSNSTVKRLLWVQVIPLVREMNHPHQALPLYLPHHRHPEYLHHHHPEYLSSIIHNININLTMNSSSVHLPLSSLLWLMPYMVQPPSLSHRYILPTISAETIRIMSASIVLMQSYLARLDKPFPSHHHPWLVLIYMILDSRHHG